MPLRAKQSLSFVCCDRLAGLLSFFCLLQANAAVWHLAQEHCTLDGRNHVACHIEHSSSKKDSAIAATHSQPSVSRLTGSDGHGAASHNADTCTVCQILRVSNLGISFANFELPRPNVEDSLISGPLHVFGRRISGQISSRAPPKKSSTFLSAVA